MAYRRIRIYGDPVLRKVAKPVEQIDATIKELAQDMIETMYANDGVGLSATQLGEEIRIFVMDPHEEDGRQQPWVFINPVIHNRSGSVEMEEGCLSLPGIRADVKRAEEFDFEASDLNGLTVQFRAQGLIARIIQHENDHLDGKMFVDYFSPVKRILIKEQLKELEAEALQSQK